MCRKLNAYIMSTTKKLYSDKWKRRRVRINHRINGSGTRPNDPQFVLFIRKTFICPLLVLDLCSAAFYRKVIFVYKM